MSLGAARFGAVREHLEASGENVSLQVSDWSNAPRVELRVGRQTTTWNTDDAATLQLEAFARLLQIGERTENRSTFGEAIAALELK